ncbi:ferredoxin [Blastococcus sp. TF02A-26]|uniref:ferredoxin n=1 Tax=Blastococcus sp. TF02A-26 TaxID=2250577 RepID=UPI0013144F76|nr:ferredoxin [Blastococcus sp. TF02A-26]
MSALRVRVHRDRCLATAACVYTAPGVFDVGDDAVVAVVGDPDSDPEAVRNAVAECPVAALELVED